MQDKINYLDGFIKENTPGQFDILSNIQQILCTRKEYMRPWVSSLLIVNTNNKWFLEWYQRGRERTESMATQKRTVPSPTNPARTLKFNL